MVRFSDIIKIQDRNWKPSQVEGIEGFGEALMPGKSPFPGTETERPAAINACSRDLAGNEPAVYYEKFIARASEVQERVRGGQGISPSPILSDLHYIIDKDLVDKLYNHVMSAGGDRKDFVIHAVDVTFTCLMIGKGMDYDIKTLLKLGLAAFLENAGMYKLPDSLLMNTKRLNHNETAMIKKHPAISHDILISMGEKYKWLADTALQVHERSDGSGYPKGLKGCDIMEPASIIGLVDSFMAMIQDRPYREKFIRTEAVKSIMEAGKGLFPPRIVKVFFNQISLFPINSFIRLNNGFVGRVTATDKNQPLRPTVEVLYDGSGNKLNKTQIVRLSEMPLLHIDAGVDLRNVQ
jgi:hypothetical protein